MNITSSLNPKTIAILDKYGSSTGSKVGTELLNTIQRAQSSEMIIPMVGMQGRGKSTLLNGLLGADILPNEVDETTCVPVEIKYGEKFSAVAFLKSGTITLKEKEELRQYVDNNYNKGNEKDVIKIVMTYPCDLLKDGLILVDLPGAGSMTLVNEETTKRYIQNVITAIFVINICPTILKSEANFIRACWSQFTSALFVLNARDETELEKKDSYSFNIDVLRDISKKISCSYTPEDSIIVNAYQAVKSAIDNNTTLRKESNIQQLETRLKELATNWTKKNLEALQCRIELCFEATLEQIKSLLDEIHSNRSDAIAKREKEYNDYHKNTIELEDRIHKTKRELRNLEEDYVLELKKLIRKAVADTKTNVFLKIDNEHIYDGQRLNRILQDEQTAMIDCLSDYIIEKLNELKSKIECMSQELAEVIIDDHINYDNAGIYRNQALKWETHLDVAGSIGGGVAAVLGAKGLAIAIAGTGPAGWVIGACGLAIFAIGSLLGLGGKKAMRAKRASEAKSALRPIFEDIESQLIKTITNNVEDVCENMRTSLDKVIDSRQDDDSNLKKNITNIPDSSEEKELLDAQGHIKQLLNV